MKSKLLFVLPVVALFGLVGCGNTKTSSEAKSSKSTTSQVTSSKESSKESSKQEEKTKFQITMGETTYNLQHNEAPLDPSFDEWFALGVHASVGDKLVCIDNEPGEGADPTSWEITNLDGASSGFEVSEGHIVCTEEGTYDIYLKFQFNNDQVYIGKSAA